MRYQELLFSASVLGAAIALHNCRHPDQYALRTVDFPARSYALCHEPLPPDLRRPKSLARSFSEVDARVGEVCIAPINGLRQSGLSGPKSADIVL
jgi:hypothetical protein